MHNCTVCILAYVVCILARVCILQRLLEQYSSSNRVVVSGYDMTKITNLDKLRTSSYELLCILASTTHSTSQYYYELVLASSFDNSMHTTSTSQLLLASIHTTLVVLRARGITVIASMHTSYAYSSSTQKPERQNVQTSTSSYTSKLLFIMHTRRTPSGVLSISMCAIRIIESSIITASMHR